MIILDRQLQAYCTWYNYKGENNWKYGIVIVHTTCLLHAAYMHVQCLHSSTQFVLLRVLNQLLLTTLVRFTSSLRLDQVELVPHHVPGSAMFKGLLQLVLMYSGRHLVVVLSPQELVKLLVVSSIR